MSQDDAEIQNSLQGKGDSLLSFIFVAISQMMSESPIELIDAMVKDKVNLII